MLVSGASAKPAYRLQRRRARISREETAHVVDHHRGWVARQDALEMPARLVVLPLQEEGPGEFQAHPDQAGVSYQHCAQGRDGLFQQGPPGPLPATPGFCDAPIAARPMRKSTFASTSRPRARGRKDIERVGEPAAIDQRPSFGLVSRHVRTGSGWRHGLDHGAQGRGGEQETGDGGASERRRGIIIICITLMGVCRSEKKRVAEPATLIQYFELLGQDLMRRA